MDILLKKTDQKLRILTDFGKDIINWLLKIIYLLIRINSPVLRNLLNYTINRHSAV